jgi:hypothetical protein
MLYVAGAFFLMPAKNINDQYYHVIFIGLKHKCHKEKLILSFYSSICLVGMTNKSIKNKWSLNDIDWTAT